MRSALGVEVGVIAVEEPPAADRRAADRLPEQPEQPDDPEEGDGGVWQFVARIGVDYPARPLGECLKQSPRLFFPRLRKADDGRVRRWQFLLPSIAPRLGARKRGAWVHR